MLDKAFPEETLTQDTILHSDQGWQYQHEAYHRFLASQRHTSVHVSQGN